MNREDTETELLLMSNAVERLRARMYAGRPYPKPVVHARAIIRKSIDEIERRPSIGSGSQKEAADKLIYEAIAKGDLPLFVLPASTEDMVHRAPLRVPPGLLERMISARGGLPDHAVQPRRIFGNDQIAAALSTSALYVRGEEFDAWCEEERKKGKWPSQRSRSKKKPTGRPSTQINLHIPIAKMVTAGQWSAEQNFIADLVRLLKSQGLKASRQTVQRAVELLHRETGDPRFHHADPRTLPDESVWGSFEDLAKRRRWQHRK